MFQAWVSTAASTDRAGGRGLSGRGHFSLGYEPALAAWVALVTAESSKLRPHASHWRLTVVRAGMRYNPMSASA
jgi:hypothetical protein